MLRMILTALGVIMFAGPAMADSDMRQHPHEYPCKWVHGRYGNYQGSGTRRIWIIGTHHIVHMWDEDETPLPADLVSWNNAEIDRFYQQSDRFLYGDFRICPLERDVAGHSRHVRIRGARHLIWNSKPYSR